MREQMVEAYKQDWCLIPLKADSKEPNLPKGHPYLTRKPTYEEYKGFKFGNYGIVTGIISGICVLDIDGTKGVDSLLSREVAPSAIETPQVLTPKGRHLYFKYNPGVKTRVDFFGGNSGVDIRSTGAYVVGPGSEVFGQVYAWDDVYDINTPLAEPPEWLYKEVVSREDQLRDWKIDQRLGEGIRNKSLISLAGTLVIRDLPHPVVEEILQLVNQRLCEPPLDREEVKKIAISEERYRGKIA